MSLSSKIQGHQSRSSGWQSHCLAGLALAVLVCFTWLPMSYFRMVGWPWILVWQGGFLAITLWGLGSLRRFRQPFLPLGHGFDLWIVGLLVVLVLTSLTSAFPACALWNLSLVLPYGWWLYSLQNWIDLQGSGRQRLWLGLVGIAGITALISLSLWRPDPIMWQTGNFQAAMRNPQPLGHHNFVGGYFALTLPLVLAYGLGHQGWRRGLGLAVALLTLATLYISGSRGAALGMVVWASGVLLLRAFKSKGPQKRRRLLLSGVAMVLLLALVFTNPRVQDWFRGLRIESPSGAVVTITDGPTLDRWFMVRTGGNILRHRPLVGVGPGNMSRVSMLYRPIEIGGGLSHVQQLHNTPVQLAGELGIGGIVLYLAGVSLVGRLGCRLSQRDLAPQDRALLYGIGGSFLAYGVSSLMDYQLENIPISGTLVVMVGLLLSLANRYDLAPVPLTQRPRRWISLLAMMSLGLYVVAWVPFDLALFFGRGTGVVVEATDQLTINNRALKAAELAPWDPTFSALNAEALVKLQDFLPTADQAGLKALSLNYAERAVRAAPNDAWFNQNLAVLYQPVDLAKAETFAARAVQLLSRNDNFGYYLLGQIYLAQGEVDKAITALTLESLVRPAFLSYPLWQMAPYDELWAGVVDRTLAEYERLLIALPSSSEEANQVDQQKLLLQWWSQRPFTVDAPERLSPLIQALLLAEGDPQAAFQVLQSRLGQASVAPLAAWLAPAASVEGYLDQLDLAQADPQIRDALRSRLLQNPPLRPWLMSSTETLPRQQRGGVAYAYRNQKAQTIELMLRPDPIERYALLHRLGAFAETWPREFPILDHRLVTIKADSLNLPAPIQNDFQPIPSLPPD